MDAFYTAMLSDRQANGLTCYIAKEKVPDSSMFVCLTVRAGSAFEKEKEQGLLHFLEHLSAAPVLCGGFRNTCGQCGFLAFDHAFTSFYETSYVFKAVDPEGVLLWDSLLTARGILDGRYLEQSAFLATKRDVLNECDCFMRKPWYEDCLAKFRRISISLPVGLKENVENAGLSEMERIRKQFYTRRQAAVIVVSPQEAGEVYGMLEKAFGDSSGSLFPDERREAAAGRICAERRAGGGGEEAAGTTFLYAWYPRSVLPAYETLQKNMFLSVLTAAIEVSFAGWEKAASAECSVDIFSSCRYLFKVKLTLYRPEGRVEDLREMASGLSFDEKLFTQARTEILTQLEKQDGLRRTVPLPGELVKGCREHFLFSEPFTEPEQEYAFCCASLKRIGFEETREAYLKLMWELLDVPSASCK